MGILTVLLGCSAFAYAIYGLVDMSNYPNAPIKISNPIYVAHSLSAKSNTFDEKIGAFTQETEIYSYALGQAGVYTWIIPVIATSILKMVGARCGIGLSIGLFWISCIFGITFFLIGFSSDIADYVNGVTNFKNAGSQSWNSSWELWSSNNIYIDKDCDGYDYKVEYDGLYNVSGCDVYEKTHSTDYVSHCCAYNDIIDDTIHQQYQDYQWKYMQYIITLTSIHFTAILTHHLSFITGCAYCHKPCHEEKPLLKGIELTIV
jgi:hypothetical protein